MFLMVTLRIHMSCLESGKGFHHGMIRADPGEFVNVNTGTEARTWMKVSGSMFAEYLSVVATGTETPRTDRSIAQSGLELGFRHLLVLSAITK